MENGKLFRATLKSIKDFIPKTLRDEPLDF